jgi:uncharacterized protein (TIGR03437 family)
MVTVGGVSAQTLSNQSLRGKYFFRQVSLGTDAAGNLSDPRSLMGTLTFDGGGHYSFTGQQVAGNNAATSQTGSGVYAVDAAGFVSLDNPLRSGVKLNARLGTEALLGSSTEAADSTFDLFVAIPAPGGPSGSGAALSGPYWTVTLEFPGASAANARNTIFSLNNGAAGTLASFTVSGHAANLSGGQPATQQVSGATYTLNSDGTGTASFGAASNTALLSGSRALYLSADGNVILGGSTTAGSHDILIGVKAASGVSNSTWSGNYWSAGLRYAPAAADVMGFSGSVSARGTGSLTLSRRIKELGYGAADFTAVDPYTLNSNGSGTVLLSQVGLGAKAGTFVGSAIDPTDPGAFEIDFGTAWVPVSGSGIFLDPRGIVNGASFAPAGNPISPGEFITLFGTGFAKISQSATPPYPITPLNGVTVLVNNKPAPIAFVGPTQINALVPYATQGPIADIVVESGGASSNTVTVPVAATAPGVFSLDQSGGGLGAILHVDYSVVNAAKPAAPGETVLVFLTGLGAVNPAVADGTAGGSSPLSTTAAAPVEVLVAGEQALIVYNGLAPGFPGLYQINVTLPPYVPATGNLPVAISTPNAYHDQVSIPIGH